MKAAIVGLLAVIAAALVALTVVLVLNRHDRHAADQARRQRHDLVVAKRNAVATCTAERDIGTIGPAGYADCVERFTKQFLKQEPR